MRRVLSWKRWLLFANDRCPTVYRTFGVRLDYGSSINHYFLFFSSSFSACENIRGNLARADCGTNRDNAPYCAQQEQLLVMTGCVSTTTAAAETTTTAVTTTTTAAAAAEEVATEEASTLPPAAEEKATTVVTDGEAEWTLVIGVFRWISHELLMWER